ncbi:MAG: ABC transporter ATP-binding protein [Thermodesulfobacteriota bacterium]
MVIVEATDLARSFGEVQAVAGLTFSVEEGEIFGLVGPDGSGKTTCLRMLAGLIRPSGGRALVLGHDVAEEPEAIKRDIGYMSMPAGLYDDLTVAENIEFYAELYMVPRSQYRERMDRLLTFSGLAPFTGRLFRNLSGGMKQKVGLTCALIHRPNVLFLDEPTNGVDPVSRRDFWKILYELKREQVTVVVASTYLDEADRCHRVALFDQGRVRLVMEPLAMRALLPGRLYNLVCPDRRSALKLIRGLPQAISPSIFGAGLHFSLADEAELPRVTGALAAAGVRDYRLEPIAASLEDVYLALIAQSVREEKP